MAAESGEDARRTRIVTNPLDVDGNNFDCEAYLSRLLKQKSLSELLDIEHKVVQEVRRLDSDMQTLVYENYNKFITATDTIRKMKADFVKMEDEMDKLAKNMQRITECSERVSGALSGQRNNVDKLAKANRTLKNLEFILELPVSLQAAIDRKDYSVAVRSYLRAKAILDKYKNVPAFSSIYVECEGMVEELVELLKEDFRKEIASTKEVGAAVELLLQLGESGAGLAREFLDSGRGHLETQLEELRRVCGLKKASQRPSDSYPSLPVDVLEFVDAGCSRFLGDLSLLVTSYSEMFSSADDHALIPFVDEMMEKLLEVAEERFLLEKSPSDSSLIVRALDRLYRRLQASSKLLPTAGNVECGLAMLIRVAGHQVRISYSYLESQLLKEVKEIRQQVASSQKTLLSPATPGTTAPGAESLQLLSELLSRLEQSTVHNLKTALANLLQFTAYDITFASQPQFLASFGGMVREELVTGFFDKIVEMGTDFCEGRGDKAYVNATLILVLSKFAKNLEASTAGYILDLCEQQFRLGQVREQAETKRTLTPSSHVSARLGAVGQQLLDHYVEMEGFALSQLLVKSVETRDWLGCVEPRAVRSVMKRVVEDLSGIESRVGQLLEEGVRRDRSSDSSRRTGGVPSQMSRVGRTTTAPLGDSALSQTLGKLWTERIDYFASVEFTKVSVLTGIVKICLKTLLESVRLRTFGKYGLQQVQVDSHYLQLYLWRFVSDEHLVHCLLDEVVSSAVHRCVQPQLMEPSVVGLICDRG